MSFSPYNSRNPGSKKSAKLITFLSIGLLLVVQYQRAQWPFASDQACPPVVDDQTDPFEQKQEPEETSLDGSYLVVIEESEKRSVERLKILNNYHFWFQLRDRGLKGFRVIDPNSPDSTSFIDEAKSHSISHPFVMHVSSDGKVLNTIPFPSTIEEIEAMLK